LSLGLGFLSSPTTLLTTEHFLKLIENVTKWTLAARTTLCLSKLIREAFETCESLAAAKRTSSSEGTLPTEWVIRLLITSHSRLVIDATLIIITESLVGIINLRELLLRLSTRVDIRMVLFGQLEVRLLHIGLRCVPVNIEQSIEVLVTWTSTSLR